MRAAAGGRQAKPGRAEHFASGCVPFRQKDAAAFLRGEVPGLLDSMGISAVVDPEEGFVESDETVERLRRWREESAH